MSHSHEGLNIADLPLCALESLFMARKDIVVPEIERRHSKLFGKTAKSIALKLKDLKTEELFNRIEEMGAPYVEMTRVNGLLRSYFNNIDGTLDHARGMSPEQLVKKIDRDVAPAIMAHWNEFYNSKKSALDDIAARKAYIINRADAADAADEMFNSFVLPMNYLEPKGARFARFPLFFKHFINNIAYDDYFPQHRNLVHYIDKKIAADMTTYGVISKNEAKLIRDLLKLSVYRHLGREFLEDAQTDVYEHKLADKCSFYGHKSELNPIQMPLINLIHDMESACIVLDSGLEAVRLEKDTFFIINIPSLPDVIDNRSFNLTMHNISAELSEWNGGKIRFVIHDQMGVDHGGVTRMILYKLGTYIATILKKENGLYYLYHEDGSSLRTSLIKYIATFFKLVIATGTKVELPLSYGLLFILRGGNWNGHKKDVIDNPSSLDLGTLMALYRKENPEDFNLLLNMVAMSDEDIAEYLPEYPQSSQVPQGAEYNTETKLAWLHTVLYKKLFYPYSSDPSALATLISFMPEALLTGKFSLEKIAELFKIELTREAVLSIPIGTSDPENPSAMRNIEYLKRFLRDHPDRWEQTLVFIHGSLRTDKEIMINHVSVGLPVAHTCFGSLDVRPYESYEQFERDFIYAIDNTSGMHIA